MLAMCYKRIMRDWVREKLMRRRKKPVTNNSESTGKIGHEIPQDQPTPLQPSYPPPLEREGRSQEFARAQSGEPAAVERQDAATDDSNGSDIHDFSDETPETFGPGEEDSGAPRQEHSSSPRQATVPDLGQRQRRDRNRGRNRNRNQNQRKNRMERVPGENQPRDASSRDSELNGEDLYPSGPSAPMLVHETQPDSLAVPPAAPQAAKSPKGYVVLAIGLPGSGKTTWFKRRGVTPLSSDMLRSILFDDITEQRYQGLVFSTLRSLLRARLIAKMPWNYVDATNLSPHERRQWIKMARSFGYEVHAVFFDVPFEVCMERNTRRDYMVNEAAMRTMQERLRPPSFKEGFHKITVVRVKNSPGAALEELPPQG